MRKTKIPNPGSIPFPKRTGLLLIAAALLCLCLGACATTEVQVRGQHDVVFGKAKTI